MQVKYIISSIPFLDAFPVMQCFTLGLATYTAILISTASVYGPSTATDRQTGISIYTNHHFKRDSWFRQNAALTLHTPAQSRMHRPYPL